MKVLCTSYSKYLLSHRISEHGAEGMENCGGLTLVDRSAPQRHSVILPLVGWMEERI